ncbi:MAG: hypothetical protein CMJ18_08160 [Phycisphaeraceae bacterium]|nr:hypothetical protein [Phycisphaeraceae bacterium]
MSAPRHANGVRRWAARRRMALSGAGSALIVGTILSGVMAIVVQSRLSAPLVLALAAWILLSGAIGFAYRPGLRMSPVPPARTVVGCPFGVEVEVNNPTRRPALDISLTCDDLPSPITIAGAMTTAPRLDPGQSIRLGLQLRADRRGVWETPTLRLVSTFPGNLFRFFGASRPLRVTAIPRAASIESVIRPADRKGGDAIHFRDPRPGDGPEYFSSREFRFGDSPRRVDARASARLGRIVVKEYLANHPSSLAVVLDTCPTGDRSGSGRADDGLEAVVCVATTILHVANAARDEVAMYAPGFGACGQGFGRLLDFLAIVEPCGADSLIDLVPILSDHRHDLGTAVFVLTDWDAPRARVVDAVLDLGCPVRVFVVRDDPPTDRLGSPVPGRVAVTQVSAERVVRLAKAVA